MRALATGLILLLGAGPAVAGAWPRERGTTFVSVSQTASTGARTLVAAVQDVRSYTSIFAEHGLTDRLTLGIDAGRARGSDGSADAALVFLRHPVWTGGEGHRVAAELGFGTLEESNGAEGRQIRIRPGLAWGRGFESRWGGGWLGIEASWEVRLPSDETAFKADLTVGIKPNDDWMLIGQVQTGRYPEAEPIVRLAPSVVYRLGSRAHVQAGLVGSVAGDDAVGGKLALWLSF